MAWTSQDFDVAVIGAGAAGLGAAAHLQRAGLSLVVVEARDRVGGRGHTVSPAPGLPLDLGCGWLHSADQNPWTTMAQTMGFTVDCSPAPWSRPALEINFPPEDQKAYRAAFQRFEDRLEEAALHEPDRPASALLDTEQARWRPLLNAFSGYYNGAPFDQISIHDYAAYQPTEKNWRVREGYGALMTAYAQPLPVVFDTPVARIDHSGASVKLHTGKGTITAAMAIVAVPTTVLAQEGLTFDPPLSHKRDAAAALPLGHVNKAFLRLATPNAFDADTRVYGRLDTEDTAGYSLRPMGLDVVEAYFGGELAGQLEQEGENGFFAFAISELTALFGSDIKAQLSPLASSAWTRDPFSRGAYSHARPGMAGMRAVLAAPVDQRLFVAGEACSLHAFSTAHGAYQTGVVAADAVIAALRPRR